MLEFIRCKRIGTIFIVKLAGEGYFTASTLERDVRRAPHAQPEKAKALYFYRAWVDATLDCNLRCATAPSKGGLQPDTEWQSGNAPNVALYR